MTESFRNDLILNANKINLELNDLMIEQLYKFYIMLVEKNKVMNLTAITEEHDVIVKHFIDSMCIYNMELEGNRINNSFLKDKFLIDVGTGAGFPGLVLKILFPDLNIVLSDSLKKRLNFIEDVIKELKLDKIELVHGRAEDLAHDPKFREKFDFSTSRAVANLSTLTEYDLPFVKLNGYFIAYKSGKIEEELNQAEKAIKILGGKVENQIHFVLTDDISERSIIFIRKIKNTGKNYPRKAGTPSKSPL
ncbi:16S rRNA (guanine(527)-N(7))-methyltransferase RsmG [Oribacterium sp. P6A1]|uniref:16S rRNA (guanine(527)-N(7))-methyltransferase RsmG n=1 Tax=Oribacterium sp. P6A1 TaxID=1410612 RepID=UPI00056A115F|nr:16S rRNA (guanine(527)-N(7))-methyltransferase RsmG [Oribacterium sp. P6A1]